MNRTVLETRPLQPTKHPHALLGYEKPKAEDEQPEAETAAIIVIASGHLIGGALTVRKRKQDHVLVTEAWCVSDLTARHWAELLPQPATVAHVPPHVMQALRGTLDRFGGWQRRMLDQYDAKYEGFADAHSTQFNTAVNRVAMEASRERAKPR